jgi:hypothetical protein
MKGKEEGGRLGERIIKHISKIHRGDKADKE